MINAPQVHACLAELSKAAAAGTLARVGVGAASGAALAGLVSAGGGARTMKAVDDLERQGAITPAERTALRRHTLTRLAGRLAAGATAGGMGGYALPHAAAAAKRYSGAAAQHLGREFGRGVAEHVTPAARAAMHEVVNAAPAAGRAVASGAAEHAAPAARAVLHEVSNAAPAIGHAAGEGAARGAAKGTRAALTPSWVGALKEHAARFIREE